MTVKPPTEAINPVEERGHLARVVSFDRGTGVLEDAAGHTFTVHCGLIINPRRDIPGYELVTGDRVRYEPMGIGDQASWVYRLPGDDV